jgi:hypothetical protein
MDGGEKGRLLMISEDAGIGTRGLFDRLENAQYRFLCPRPVEMVCCRAEEVSFGGINR